MKRDSLFIPETPSPSWEIVAETANYGHTLIVLGEVDTGKSALCRYVAQHALRERLYVGYVDADIGQSLVGPPTTLGLKILRDSIEELTQTPEALVFVGATSPAYVVTEVVVGVHRLVNHAHLWGVDLVIVDTTGFVSGPVAYQLKTQKIESIRPAIVTAIKSSENDKALEPILSRFEDQTDIRILRLLRDPAVETKSPADRHRFRQESFDAHFGKLVETVLSLEEVSVVGEVLVRPDVTPEMLRETAFGILNERGFTQAVGILRELDVNSRKIHVAIPSSFEEEVRRIHLSRFHPYHP